MTVGVLCIFVLRAPQLRCEPAINPTAVAGSIVEQTQEFKILQKLWGAYLGPTARPEVNELLTKGYGDEIFNLRVGLESWLKFLNAPLWLEYRPLGQAGPRDVSELIALISLPDGDYRVSFVFLTGSDHHTRFHDLWVAPIVESNRNFWILSNLDAVKKPRDAYNSLRDNAKTIAGINHDYEKMSELLADFRELAQRLNLLNHQEVQNFLMQSDRLQAFGAAWNKTKSTVMEGSFKSEFSSVFVSSLKASLSKSGASLDATAEATIKKVVEAEVKNSQKETIEKLDDQQAEKFTLLKKDLAKAYEALLTLLGTR